MASMFTAVASADPVPRTKNPCSGRLRRGGTDVAEPLSAERRDLGAERRRSPTPKSPLWALPWKQTPAHSDRGTARWRSCSIAVDLLRRMYQAPDRDTAHRGLVTFYEWVVAVEVDEVTRLAKTSTPGKTRRSRSSTPAGLERTDRVRQRQDHVDPAGRPRVPQLRQLRGPDPPPRQPAA